MAIPIQFRFKKTSILSESSFFISNIPVTYHARIIVTIALLHKQKLCQRWDFATALHLSCSTSNIFEKKYRIWITVKSQLQSTSFYWYFISELLKFKTRSFRNTITAVLIKYYFENNFTQIKGKTFLLFPVERSYRIL